ncbi:hypothetical protein KVT40_003515 [Elsinoe batatas]|uniref:Mtf2-like C-terminal domain-containing protein n=1 Tax=Elsinoe batatas TaxID=2601811 RepID=A0A8K0L8Y1_9PEZI|nr:hypothetical protein KVT40_003515 [Elsinoe batatas]
MLLTSKGARSERLCVQVWRLEQRRHRGLDWMTPDFRKRLEKRERRDEERAERIGLAEPAKRSFRGPEDDSTGFQERDKDPLPDNEVRIWRHYARTPEEYNPDSTDEEISSPSKRDQASYGSEQVKHEQRAFNILRDRLPSEMKDQSLDTPRQSTRQWRFGERSNAGGAIPFDNLAKDYPFRSKDSSMTRREQATLRKLLNQSAPTAMVAQSPPAVPMNAKPPPAKRPTSVLDALLDDIKAKERISASSRSPRPRKTADLPDLNTTVEEVQSRRKSIRIQQEEQHKVISRNLSKAQDDFEVWKILQEDILKPVADMHLDDPRVSQDSTETTKGRKKSIPTMETFGNNFASQVRTAAATLRNHFPTSQIRGIIIPELRKLGPTAFALGASTGLYNELLDYVALQNEDYTATLDLLNEMEREVIDPNHMTLEILLKQRRFQNNVRMGKYGHGARIALMTTSRHVAVIQEIGQKLRDMVTYLQAKGPGEDVGLSTPQVASDAKLQDGAIDGEEEATSPTEV